MSDDVAQPVCPNPDCASEPGEVSYSMAPAQAACVQEDCPVVSWDTTIPA